MSYVQQQSFKKTTSQSNLRNQTTHLQFRYNHSTDDLQLVIHSS